MTHEELLVEYNTLSPSQKLIVAEMAEEGVGPEEAIELIKGLLT